MRPTTLALCGTFDSLTCGDALASLIIEANLRKRLKDLSLIRYASSARTSDSWLYEVRALDDFERDLPTLSGVLVGDLEALNFSPVESPDAPSRIGVGAPADSWLATALAAAGSGIPVCWNSAALRNTPAWAHPMLTLALDLSRYVSARDADVVDELRSAGFIGDAPIVPSVLYDIPRLVPGKMDGGARPPAVQAWLQAAGATDDYVVVQDHDGLRALLPGLTKTLALRGVSLVSLPLPEAASRLEPLLQAADPAPLAPEEIAALIGHSAGIVAVDESLVTIGLAYGIPALMPAGCQCVHAPFAPDEVVAGQPDASLPEAFLERLGKFSLCATARNARSILDVHWNNLAAHFGQEALSKPPSSTPPYQTWTRMLLASQAQNQRMEAAARASTLVETEQRLRAELAAATTDLQRERTLRQQEAELHQIWRAAAGDRHAETESERQRLHAMKRSFDAALAALTLEKASLRHSADTMLETLRKTTQALRIRDSEIRAREGEIRAREGEIQEIRSSLSWRVTEPLRTAKDTLLARRR
ncbi:hypothetical protein [Achromobacter arsenitoxydans]|uniref:ABC transporter ATP-binding protein n=1 Tax=Achromobacter arsenitoxydans SY8 TaxID=477184 RepID=H0F4C9_9BURK|nr:hypothetical protein [Achromobacter arsenitoxydans]EHK66878.1 ABC transporter ATP-binding protein [Achromobacter arsenitoxydans SY8]